MSTLSLVAEGVRGKSSEGEMKPLSGVQQERADARTWEERGLLSGAQKGTVSITEENHLTY